MGQNLLIGYTGQISFGQAGFLAIGAFTFGHLRIWGVPFLIALAGAGLIAALAGVLVGFPSLRLKGPYLAIVTLGFGIAVFQVFVNWEVLSGGRSGLAIPKLKPLLGLSAGQSVYYIYVLLLAAFTLATYTSCSYVGRAFVAIRDAEIAAEVNGINLTRYKLLAFALSSFYTCVHGASTPRCSVTSSRRSSRAGVDHALRRRDHRRRRLGGGLDPGRGVRAPGAQDLL